LSIFHRERAKDSSGDETGWIECPFCREITYRREVERQLWVCPKCTYHYPIPVDLRISLTADEGSFEELFREIRPKDPLKFKDEKSYRSRLKSAQGKDPGREALLCGMALLDGRRIVLCVQDFTFMGGSMGSVVGERLALAAELCRDEGLPLVVFAASGGARMQEGLLSLMQMAKTAVCLNELKARGIPFLSILTDPTTGGVAASYAMMGDVILAEPRSRVGFAGPRVIERTIGQRLPDGFQRAEYLLEHGLIDMIVPRSNMRATLGRVLALLMDPVMPEQGQLEDPEDAQG
jgi:acetyl-CoA carboxylase carboxyl transferase subunit beta